MLSNLSNITQLVSIRARWDCKNHPLNDIMLLSAKDVIIGMACYGKRRWKRALEKKRKGDKQEEKNREGVRMERERGRERCRGS